ncbi:MAG: RNA methyltransferase [Desulfopila sp.]
MEQQRQGEVNIALIHHPVLGRNNETIGSAVTNLDIHDIARTAKTYGVHRYYIVTPYHDQQQLVGEIIDHWQTGHGSTYNPARKKAFELVRPAGSLDEVIEAIGQRQGRNPARVTTSALHQEKALSYSNSRKRMAAGEPTLLIFGTAHGLAAEVTAKADYTLPAIMGRTGYNHLSVRAAVAIICDRLLGESIDKKE